MTMGAPLRFDSTPGVGLSLSELRDMGAQFAFLLLVLDDFSRDGVCR